jgi:hypothetical protein
MNLMYKKLLTFFFVFCLLFIFSKPAYAINDPLKVANNKFGIHIMNENDFSDARNLVNSEGGDWGYVTFVITEKERDHDRWQKVFDQMRRLHLIPIVRLATKANGGTWDVPQEVEINNWVSFLNSLNWVIQNRYIIISNEPNHADEWGGRIDPSGYSRYLKTFSEKLKETSGDFFVLPAGLDPSSGNTKTTMTEAQFLRLMKAATPDVFDHIDGWTSHAYPNAGIDIYNHELSLINKNLPVFITETGWKLDKYSESEISDNLQNAFKNIWSDSKVVAVTPFILNYTSPPFDIYSWKKNDGSFYSFYEDIRKIPKLKGSPVQIESGQILAAFAQPVIIRNTDFVGAILARNTGQSIWKRNEISIGNESGDFDLKGYTLSDIEPTMLGMIFFRAAEIQKDGIYTNSLFITGSKSQKITNSFSIEAALTSIDNQKIQVVLNSLLKHLMKP